MKNGEILDSWKAISEFLDRDVRTCYRWERNLELPVHRIDESSSRSKVFAYKSEIEDWLRERANHKEIEKKKFLENRWVKVGLVSGLALATALFAYLYFFQSQTILPSSESPSIAVLPFENLNPSEYEEYFSEGLTNEIIHRLTLFTNLRVLSLVSAEKYKDSAKTVKQIGAELGVEFILKGNVEKEDDNIKLNVSLIEIEEGKKVWNKGYEGHLEDIFSIQSSICQKTAQTLGIDDLQQTPELYSLGRNNNYQAYENYLKGNHILNNFHKQNSDPWKLYHQGKYYSGKSTKEGNELAIALFSQALKLDDRFAQAYLGLANCYINFKFQLGLRYPMAGQSSRPPTDSSRNTS